MKSTMLALGLVFFYEREILELLKAAGSLWLVPSPAPGPTGKQAIPDIENLENFSLSVRRASDHENGV